jgi:hypothetical protein
VLVLIVAALILSVGASIVTYRHVLADFFNSGQPTCGEPPPRLGTR